MGKIILTVTILIIGGLWLWQAEKGQDDSLLITPNETAISSTSVAVEGTIVPLPTAGTQTHTASSVDVPADWQFYSNDVYGFSVYVPPDLVLREYDEGSGVRTFSFEKSDTQEGFQVFVVPYAEETVSEARLLMDIPSGVVREQVEIVIDGEKATAFFSQHALMGETREVWFIHDGYLFEVTTYKELDTWLAEIMQTWEFK